jgi:casein kinase 1
MSRQGTAGDGSVGSPASGMVLSPTPAHLKAARRPTDGRASRDMSTAALPPASRRQSGAGAAAPPSAASAARHPYAAAPTSPGAYPSYGRAGGAGAGLPQATTEQAAPYAYGAPAPAVAAPRAMNVYDGGAALDRPDADDGHGRKKGFFASLCCGA